MYREEANDDGGFARVARGRDGAGRAGFFAAASRRRGSGETSEETAARRVPGAAARRFDRQYAYRRRHAIGAPGKRSARFYRRERGVERSSRRRGDTPLLASLRHRGDTVARRGGAPSRRWPQECSSIMPVGAGAILHAVAAEFKYSLPYDSRAASRRSRDEHRRRRRRGHDAAAPRRVAPRISTSARSRATILFATPPPARVSAPVIGHAAAPSRRDTDPSTRFASSPTRIAQVNNANEGRRTGDSRPRRGACRRDGRREVPFGFSCSTPAGCAGDHDEVAGCR